MSTWNSAHSWHCWDRRCNWARCKVNNSLAIWPRASDPLGRTFANKQAITRTAHILFSGWSVSDGLKKKIKFISDIFYLYKNLRNLDNSYCRLRWSLGTAEFKLGSVLFKKSGLIKHTLNVTLPYIFIHSIAHTIIRSDFTIYLLLSLVYIYIFIFYYTTNRYNIYNCNNDNNFQND